MALTKLRPAGQGFVNGNRNLFINGAMQMAQHGTSKAMAHDGNTSVYVVDRFTMAFGGTHEQLDGTYAQVADHPLSANGKSLKWTTGTAESSYDADEYLYVAQKIEAQNLQSINNGNSNAVPITLSFYVKSSVTGTFALGIYKEDSTTRIFNRTYAISSANTWEKKTITFAGDTSGGGIVNDNGAGFWINWHLAAGSNAKGGGSNGAWKNYGGLSDWADGQATNAIATTGGATWQLAQCQLEEGDVATQFENEDLGTTLRKCHRYFQKVFAGADNRYLAGTSPNIFWNATNTDNGGITFVETMRAAPSFSYNALKLRSPYAGDYTIGSLTANAITVNGLTTTTAGSSGSSNERVVYLAGTGTSSYYEIDAEL